MFVTLFGIGLPHFLPSLKTDIKPRVEKIERIRTHFHRAHSLKDNLISNGKAILCECLIKQGTFGDFCQYKYVSSKVSLKKILTRAPRIRQITRSKNLFGFVCLLTRLL